MVQINFSLREVNCKIVYYGPGLSGKTTNLEIIHAKAPKGSTGDLTSIATEGDRTLFFDFLPLDLGQVAGMKTRFQIYTVPGQVYYNSTRKLVLQGSDGIVFVADSKRGKMPENLESLENLLENLKEYGLDLNQVSLVLQYNKRDLPDVYTIDEMNAALNKWGVPHCEAVARDGHGVFPTLKKLAGMVLESLNRQHTGAPAAATPVKAREQKVPVQVGAVGAAGAQAASPRATQTIRVGAGAQGARPQAGRGVAASAAPAISVKPMPINSARGTHAAAMGGPVPQPQRARKGRGILVGLILLAVAGAGAYLWFSGLLKDLL